MSSAQTPTETTSPNLQYQPMGLADLAYAAVNRLGRNEMVPYTQFCMDWNYYTENGRREEILEEDVRSICTEKVLPAIASVLHGLCERDGFMHLFPDYLEERFHRRCARRDGGSVLRSGKAPQVASRKHTLLT